LSKKHWLFRDMHEESVVSNRSNPLFQIAEMIAIIIVFGLMSVLQNLQCHVSLCLLITNRQFTSPMQH